MSRCRGGLFARLRGQRKGDRTINKPGKNKEPEHAYFCYLRPTVAKAGEGAKPGAAELMASIGNRFLIGHLELYNKSNGLNGAPDEMKLGFCVIVVTMDEWSDG